VDGPLVAWRMDRYNKGRAGIVVAAGERTFQRITS
jgi:hypothetical protein